MSSGRIATASSGPSQAPVAPSVSGLRVGPQALALFRMDGVDASVKGAFERGLE
jgi:hypothetical protein